MKSIALLLLAWSAGATTVHAAATHAAGAGAAAAADAAGLSNGRTALHAAAANGDLGAVRRLLSELRERRSGGGSSSAVNAEDVNGVTPLHEASEGGHEGAARLLLAAGAKVDHKAR